MEDCSTSISNRDAVREVEKEFHFWLPVIAGIATKEEIDVSTASELTILNEVALQKIKLMKGGL
ncbi:MULTISPECIES: hypothetical protein [Carnobacterium]|uniref:hypothetical protein n=1 Tax=Carnobacterium TaxID=2747 RepID=UPI00054DD9B4|nr:hypothetical protein [Carnobacterium maltaromaticum]KRN62441.1 hypothetical protein IV70_GL003557 [Carnobacterium maltaromaticum DSM 20342]MBC9808194.1 hypothetical protein [Carnobacterium maltaromaticum]